MRYFLFLLAISSSLFSEEYFQYKVLSYNNTIVNIESSEKLTTLPPSFEYQENNKNSSGKHNVVKWNLNNKFSIGFIEFEALLNSTEDGIGFFFSEKESKSYGSWEWFQTTSNKHILNQLQSNSSIKIEFNKTGFITKILFLEPTVFRIIQNKTIYKTLIIEKGSVLVRSST